MQANLKLTNTLLALIAICLGLIVVRLYDLPPRAAAAPEEEQAQRVEVTNVPLPVQLDEASLAAEAREPQRVDVNNLPLPVRLAQERPIRVQLAEEAPIRVELYYRAGNAWRPVNVDAGSIAVRQ